MFERRRPSAHRRRHHPSLFDDMRAARRSACPKFCAWVGGTSHSDLRTATRWRRPRRRQDNPPLVSAAAANLISGSTAKASWKSRCTSQSSRKIGRWLMALAAGGKDNGAPGLRPHDHPNYYGAFVLDSLDTTSRRFVTRRLEVAGRATGGGANHYNRRRRLRGRGPKRGRSTSVISCSIAYLSRGEANLLFDHRAAPPVADR
jgi:hypothetical protein